MRKLLRPFVKFALVATLTAGATAAVAPSEWRYRQTLDVPAAGLMRVEVPAETFDAALPGLDDVRIIDASGREMPFWIDRESPSDSSPIAPVPGRLVRQVSSEGLTQWVIETGTSAPLDSVHLDTSAPFFLKAAHAEYSADGQVWRSLGPSVPLFRQLGAEQLRVPLGRHRAAFIRLTVDDTRSRSVQFTAARLHTAPDRDPPLLPSLGATLSRREEFAGETVLTVSLEGRHAPLAGISLETDDAVFMRRVSVRVTEMNGDVATAHTVAEGTVYRINLDSEHPSDEPVSSTATTVTRDHLRVPFAFTPSGRELQIHVHNGDSPPLAVKGVAVWRSPVHLLFPAPAAGAYAVLSGNPQATPPRYDLAALGGDLRRARATLLSPGPRADNPDHRTTPALAEARLADVPLLGARFVADGWIHRQPVLVTAPGVQALELDAAALAGSRADFADLRLVRDGHQIPFLLERTSLARSLRLAPQAVPDTPRPAVSVWRLDMPEAGLPLQRIVLASDTALFQREFCLYEKITPAGGGARERIVATGTWSRTPEPGAPRTRAFELNDRLQTRTLFIETDNGDNPALGLAEATVEYAVTRLVFRAAETDGFELLYGNDAALAPRYDLGLVAAKLLTASRSAAKLGPRESVAGGFAQGALRQLQGGVLFWSALALVVVVLLVIVARLLPKPPQ